MTDQRQDEMPLRECREAFEKDWPNFHMDTAFTYSDNIVNSHWQEFKRGWKAAYDTRPATLTPDQVETVRQLFEDIDSDASKAINGHDALCLLGVIRSRIPKALALLPQGERKY